MQSEKFNQLREGAIAVKAKLTSPETKAKAQAAVGGVMGALVQGVGLLTYTAVSAVLSAKDGVVEALHDDTRQGNPDQK